MAQVSTASLLAGYVGAAGVRHIFGYPGESVIDFMEASRQQGLELVSAVREATAGFMAEAAAMATGRPVAIAAASAMNAAVPSRTADTTSTPRCRAASMKSMTDSPG